jgi:hypothetical protein
MRDINLKVLELHQGESNESQILGKSEFSGNPVRNV